MKDVLKNVGIGAGISAAGAASGIGTAATLSIAGAMATMPPLWIPALAGAAVGGAGYLLYKLLKKKPKPSSINRKTEGWERVEQLILRMEQRQAELLGNGSDYKKAIHELELAKDKDVKELRIRTSNLGFDEDESKDINKESLEELNKRISDLSRRKDYIVALQNTNKMISTSLRESMNLQESVEVAPTYKFFKVNFDQQAFEEAAHEVAKECCNDKDLMAEILAEKTIAVTSMPLTTKYVEKRPDKNLLVTPSFMARDNYAYGSTEIERKDNKDRKYNQPLIMTVKFKERFDDGKYTDNELTAVIGILGKIIRIPSSEMEYILRQNSEGNTVEGILGGVFSSKNSIDDLLSTSKIATELKNLPQSADVWKNLEKVSALALANKMAGRRNGNIANAHIVFSQKEVDSVRVDSGVDYLKDPKKALALMKRYSAFTLMVANDAS